MARGWTPPRVTSVGDAHYSGETSRWTNGYPYYRCRYPQEYALANGIDHPRNVYLKEEYVVPELDAWLDREFGHERLNLTIAAMAESQQDDIRSAEERSLNVEIETCERKLKQYRKALDGALSHRW